MPFFQTQVNVNQATAVEGDFAGHNIRANVLAGPGALVAAPEGVWIGRFAWLDWTRVDQDNAPAIVKSVGAGPVAGFIHREQQGLIVDWLAGAGMKVNGGFPITVHQEGDFFAMNRGATYAQVGMKAYARLSDGAVLFAPTGAAPGGASVTGAIAASTFSATGSITNNVLTISAVGAGTIVNGATFTGTGVATGTQIVSQLSGTPGGVGTYAVNIPSQNVASTAISGTYGTLTVSAAATPGIGIGTVLTGSGVVAGTTVTQLGTGTGGLGTYFVNNNTVVASTALTGGTAVETKWFAASGGLVGELVKISAWPLG
jgi:hypothetical protein